VESARVTTVIVDPQGARAWVRSDGPGPGVDTVVAIDLARGVVLSSDAPRPRFVFDPRGGASGDVLTVASPAGRSTIAVDRASGDVRVAAAPGADPRAP
jgi:hypothetical protein